MPSHQGRHGGVGPKPASRVCRSRHSSGGGSDGNFTGAMGVTTLDGLGVQGALAHTLEEHVLVDSLVPRAKLMAGLLTTLE
jgi:glutamate carboxypeptidase